ncbi:MAG: transcriptional regulator [Magnetococcales bacterium]|nr:transcriptional regulator [Magnetococcales bacterium]MBF0149435.1 transcriptional regulator [Magnetococcales bacterium]MBF0630488.1 transcriptional regulator [Magnetococcales bacterium]
MAKRKLFDELVEGINDINEFQEGKVTLRHYCVAPKPPVEIEPAFIVKVRGQMSQGVFARRLRISEATLKNWEQGRTKPPPTAAALIMMVDRFPDTLERLEALS